jgi:hypothetical protein
MKKIGNGQTKGLLLLLLLPMGWPSLSKVSRPTQLFEAFGFHG